ncbi:hypothetical protein LTR94_032500, partial [Friedmanniomyces endolithicus]
SWSFEKLRSSGSTLAPPLAGDLALFVLVHGGEAALRRRRALLLLTLLLVSVTIFIIAQLLPGDAAQEALGQSATPQQVAALRHEMGLDRPAYVRYASWLTGMVSGDPGQSLVANMPVSDVISERLPNSLLLAALTALVAVPVALAIGIGSAMNRGGRLDRALNV